MKNRYEKIWRKVQKPARYTGGEYNEVVKDKSCVDVRFAFGFPDTYEIGMSNLGIKILYGVLNSLDYVWCERVFAPLEDMAEQLRANNMDLYALESGDSLKEFDFVGFSLQYELSYTNVLYMLDLAGIYFLSKDRGEDSPLIISGGPCAYNPEPFADFFDIICIGEGEELLPEIMALYREHKRNDIGYKKREFLTECAKIEGVYVPQLYDAIYKDDGKIKSFSPKYNGVPAKIKKRIVKNFDESYFPVKPVVPNIETVHDRITVETFRGCIRGCRFCQAGFVYRPVREKSSEKINELVKETYKNTGYNEVSLASLSISDYTELYQLVNNLTEWTDKCKVNISLPSMRIDMFSQELLNKTSSVRQSTLTFAPEAGSQRMRDVINKNLSEQDILNTVNIAFESGKNNIKLYFMIGLPHETDDDIVEIANLAKKVVDCWHTNKNAKRNRGLTVTISVACFVPKCFTPFSFHGQNSHEELIRKQHLLKDAIALLPSSTAKKINYNYHDATLSMLEAVFARGDRRLSQVLIEAYSMGACFDSWDDKFNFSAWQKAFEKCGIDMREYCERIYEYGDIFPWEFIDTGVSKQFLINEHKKAYESKISDNCREKCAGCGISQSMSMGGVCGTCFTE